MKKTVTALLFFIVIVSMIPVNVFAVSIADREGSYTDNSYNALASTCDNSIASPNNNDEIDTTIPLDTSSLEDAITQAEELINNGRLIEPTDEFTAFLIEIFHEILNDAQNVLEKANTNSSEMNQYLIDWFTDELFTAINSMENPTDRSNLLLMIDIANMYIEESTNYTKDSYVIFYAAVEKADSVLYTAFSLQEEIDVACNQLINAILQLRLLTNKDALNNFIIPT